LYKLTAEDYNKSIAKKAVIYLSVFPFAFFFGGIMTESVFFLTTTACLYFIRKHKWITASLFGILATLSRMTGIILIAVALIEFCIYYKPILLVNQKRYMELWRLIYKKAVFIPFMAVGTMIYLYLNYQVEGDPFRFLFYQKNHWYQGSQYFSKTISLIFTNAFNTGNESNLQASIWMPAVLIFVMATAIIIYSIKRHNATYLSFMVMYLLINYSLTWPMSEGRYMSCAFPMYIMLAEFSERYKKADKWITVTFSIFMGIYMTAFLLCKQVM
jgi:Gpi18-like mannosyltransferase